MDYKIVWTEPALSDLQEITDYIARDNPSAAAQVGGEIIEHVEILSSFPHIGPRYPRGSSGRNREILCGSYRVFYRVIAELKRVEVLTVWHGARQEPNLPL